jgi:GT2 family glycosyltransferase
MPPLPKFKFNTFIIPLIREDLIERCLETLYANTEEDTFYVYLIDQTPNGIGHKMREKYRNLMSFRTPRTDTHHAGNLGFAKATNLGIQNVETPYFTMCNDDVEFIHPQWWERILETFELVKGQTPDRPPMMVNPSSIKLPDWSIGRPRGDHLEIIPYKEKYTDEDWRHLIEDEHYVNEHLTLMPGSVIDGVTMYCSVFDTQKFLDVGMLDERFYAGGGEDYDYNARANMAGYRCVGTTKSWVFHHWSKSIGDDMRAEIEKTQDPALRWNNNHEKWGEDFDVWGMKHGNGCETRLVSDDMYAMCPEHPDYRIDLPQTTQIPL